MALGLAAFQLARLALLLRYPDAFAALSAARVAGAWASGLRFDLSILLAFLALPLAALNAPAPFALRPRWQRAWGWVAFAALAALALLLGGDVLYFGHVQRHLAGELLTIANDWTFLVQMAFGPGLPALLAVAGGLGAVALLWRRLFAAPPDPGLRPIRFLLVVALLVVGIRGGVGHKPINAIDAFAGGDPAAAQLSLNGAFSGVRAMTRRGAARTRFMPEEEARRILGIGDAEYPMERTVPARAARHNVIFVLLESWSARYVDAFSHRGYGATPRLDALAAEGAAFTRFYAAGQRSYEGLQATLTGLPALPGIPTLTSGLTTHVSRLGELAGAAGYRTLFLQASKRRSLRLDAIAAANGFAEYYGREDMPPELDYPDPSASPFGWDYEMYRLLLRKLHGERRPFVAYLFTGTTHTPYPPLPARFEIRPHGSDTEGGFLNALRYADWSLGELVDGARAEPWFSNTVFVFVADHTRGGTEIESFDQAFHVPLVIWAPGIVEAKAHDVVGSHLDLLPTLVDLMGIGATFSAIGTPLFQKDPATATAPLMGGERVGIVAADGFLSHTLRQRSESRVEPGARPGLLDELERRLLAQCQVVYGLHARNRWARPAGAPAPAPMAGAAEAGRPPG